MNLRKIGLLLVTCFLLVNQKGVQAAPGSACDGLNPPCNCDKAAVVDCNGKNLTTADYTVKSPKKIKELCLSNNAIKVIGDNQILGGDTDGLVKLYLDHNLIYKIDDGAFDGMTLLETLYLQNNKLSVLETSMFKGLTNLVDLRLDHNLVVDLSKDSVFAPMINLKFLSMDFTPLARVSNMTFAGLSNLIELSLDHTNLTYMPEDAFQPLVNLKTLSIRHNHLTHVPSDALGFVPFLTQLDLSGNPIHTIHPNSFRYNPRLLHIDMVNMDNLKNVEECAFCNLHDLRTLKLINCSKLTVFDPEAFGEEEEYFTDLETLDLVNNSLTTLDDDVLHWGNITALRLENNPWLCDCRLIWMTKIKFLAQETPRCQSPPRLKGRLITSLRKEDMACALLAPLHSARVLTLASMLLLCVGILATTCYLWVTRSKSGMKFRNCFYKPQLPKYAYRNLAMGEEAEDPTIAVSDRNAVLSNAEDTTKHTTQNGQPVKQDLASRLASAGVDDL